MSDTSNLKSFKDAVGKAIDDGSLQFTCPVCAEEVTVIYDPISFYFHAKCHKCGLSVKE
jgi:transcription elongation factor Elf1